MSKTKVQFIISLIFLTGYLALLGIILYAELSDELNMQKGENSMQGELQILLGVLTGAVGQILSFWFGKENKVIVSGTSNELP